MQLFYKLCRDLTRCQIILEERLAFHVLFLMNWSRWCAVLELFPFHIIIGRSRGAGANFHFRGPGLFWIGGLLGGLRPLMSNILALHVSKLFQFITILLYS